MIQMKVALGFKADQEYYTVNESGNRLEIDMLPSDQKKAQSPTQLLMSGVIACAAVDIVSMIKKRRKTLTDFAGEVVGNRREEHPRKFMDMHVHYVITSPDLTEEEAHRIVELAVTNYCSVASTINESTKLTHSFEIKRA